MLSLGITQKVLLIPVTENRTGGHVVCPWSPINLQDLLGFLGTFMKHVLLDMFSTALFSLAKWED